MIIFIVSHIKIVYTEYLLPFKCLHLHYCKLKLLHYLPAFYAHEPPLTSDHISPWKQWFCRRDLFSLTFSPRDAMLAQYMLCSCLSVSRESSIETDEWFELFFRTVFPLRCWLSTNIRIPSSERPKLLTLKFRRGTSTVASAINLVRPSPPVDHAERPSLCTTRWTWRSARCEFIRCTRLAHAFFLAVTFIYVYIMRFQVFFKIKYLF